MAIKKNALPVQMAGRAAAATAPGAGRKGAMINAPAGVPDDAVLTYTTQGKPVWVKATITGDASSVNLEPGQNLQFTLSYWFDMSDHPLPGDSLVLNFDQNTFPLGQFTTPGNNHTANNTLRSGQLTLNFADVGDHKFITATQGSIGVNFYLSQSAAPGEYNPVLTGNASTSNILTTKPKITVKPSAPGPPPVPGSSYHRILKYSEHVLVGEEGNLIYVPAYGAYVTEPPVYIHYELTINYGDGSLWVDNHEEFDYVLITDTLGPGQIFAEVGEPVYDNGGNMHFDGTYSGTAGNAPLSYLGAHQNDPVSGARNSSQPLDLEPGRGVEVSVSDDRKTMTVKVSKEAWFRNAALGQIGPDASLVLYFYVKVNVPVVTRFKDNADVMFFRNGDATGGEVSHNITVVPSGSAHFIVKRSGATLETMAEHSDENPLVIEQENRIYYQIVYTVTGQDAAAGSINILDELPPQLSNAQIVNGWTSGDFSVSVDNSTVNSHGGNSTITAINIRPVTEGTVLYLVFSADVGDLRFGQTVKNVLSGFGYDVLSPSVVKKDGFMVNVSKEDDRYNPLEGAAFTLYRKIDDGYVLYDDSYYGEPDPDFTNPMVTGADGYTGLAFLPPGDYRLIETTAPKGWLLDSTPIEFRIWPGGEGEGIELLSAAPGVPDPYVLASEDEILATFTVPDAPDIDAEPAQVRLAASKTAVGAALPAGRFDFGVFDSNGNLVSTASSDGNGNVVFPTIPVARPGSYSYTIRELSLTGGGWTVDESVFPVSVTVADTGADQLEYVATYPAGTPDFTDYYATQHISERVVIYKELLGWHLPEIPFTFGLYDEDGNLLQTASNADGLVEFDKIRYTSPGVYRYTVRELTEDKDGWTFDGNEYPAVMTVTDDGEGHLTALASYPGGQPIYQNRYQASPVTVGLTAAKRAEGAALPTGMFQFGLFDEKGRQMATAVNDADGNIVFSGIRFSSEGTYNWQLRETTPSGNGWTTDSSEHPVTFTVTDEGQGQLEAHAVYPDGEPVFSNSYTAPEPPVPPDPPEPPDPSSPVACLCGSVRMLCGCQGCAGFPFALFDSSGAVAGTACSDGCGVIAFPAISYSQAGTHEYTMRRLCGKAACRTACGVSWPAAVDVTADAEGRLSALVSYPNGRPVFCVRRCAPRSRS